MLQLFMFLFLVSGIALPAEPFRFLSDRAPSPPSYFVGELGSLWQFPSDHLPVGGRVGNIHFVIWNILDTKYLQHIMDNTQGLRDSFIMQSNVPVSGGDGTLTLRENTIVNAVLQMIYHKTCPRSLIALEEVNPFVYVQLLTVLPKNMQLIPANLDGIGHGDIFIYDTDVFDFGNVQYHPYAINIRNTYSTLTLVEKKTQLTYRFVQSHVPGGPINSTPARKEFTEGIMQDINDKAITIVMGDMNGSPDCFLRDFDAAAQSCGFGKHPFTLLSIPYPTHINTHREACWIDNIFVSHFRPTSINVAKDASELFESLESTIVLLASLQPEKP